MAYGAYQGWNFPSIKVEPPNTRYLKVIASPRATGYEKATVVFSHIPPRGTTGMHTHTSDEIMYFVGRGEGMVGGKKAVLETDSVVVAPAGVEHGCWNTSQTETLKLFCVFIPPLEEEGLIGELAEKTRNYLKDK